MTSLPAAPAMTTLAGATHPDALSEAVTVVAPRRENAVVEPLAIGASGTIAVRPEAVLGAATVGARQDRSVKRDPVQIGGLAVVPIAKFSGAARC